MWKYVGSLGYNCRCRIIKKWIEVKNSRNQWRASTIKTKVGWIYGKEYELFKR
jgi:hypothetical protein